MQSSSPRWPNLRFTGPPVADVSISKKFAIKERMRLDLLAQTFNVANTLWFSFGDKGAGITTNAMSAAFGQVNQGHGNGARQMAITAKVNW